MGSGEHGEIEATPQVKDADGKWKRAPYARSAQRWRARCSYRGYDGLIGELSRFGKTKRLAVEALEKALGERLNAGVEMTSSTRLTEAGRQWLTQIKRTDSRLSAKTIVAFEGGFFRLVVPLTAPPERTGATLGLQQLGEGGSPRHRNERLRVGDTAHPAADRRHAAR